MDGDRQKGPGRLSAWLAKFAGSSSVRARMARATGLMLGGTGVQQLSAMLASVITARILGKALFGEFALIRSTTLMFAMFAGAGLGVTTTRYVAELRAADPQRTARVIRLLFTLAWGLSLAAAAVCIILAKPMAARLIHVEHLAFPLALSSIAIVLSTVGSVQIGVISGCEAFRPIAVNVAIEGIASGSLTVIGAWLAGVTGAIAGYICGLFVTFVLRHRLMVRECTRAAIPRRGDDAFSEWRLLTTFVLPAVLVGFGTQPAEWLARILLARGPGGLAEVGVFTAAMGWAGIVLFVPTQVAGPAMPILTTVLAAGDVRGFRRAVIESAAAVFGLAGLASVAIALLSPWIMALYGASFRTGAVVLAIVVSAQAFGAVTVVLRAALLALGRAWVQVSMSQVWGVAVVGCFLLLPHVSAVSLAVSYVVGFAVLLLVQGLVVWRTLGRAMPVLPNKSDVPPAVFLGGES
jgi:O-antigen/teichoic acid export membrane protein